MEYQDALREWGALRLERGRARGVRVDRATVKVEMDFDGGDDCATCSSPPSAWVSVVGRTAAGKYVYEYIEVAAFDFAEVLGEIVEAGGGELT